MGENDFKDEFDTNVLELVKQKGFYPFEYMCDFYKFKNEFPDKIDV